MNEEPSSNQELSVVDALPGLARVAAEVGWRAAWWGLEVSVRVGSRLVQVALDPGGAAELAQAFSTGMRSYAREFLGVADLDDRVRQMAPASATFSRRGRRNGDEPEEVSLRAQGAELLRQAADVSADEHAHPAFARILTELAPDEARILRLLMLEGPQPLVDVRASNLIGVGSQLVAPGLNMIGPQAGLRHQKRVAFYLDNLHRLGLIAFLDEPLDDAIAYQVLEAQPDVLEAIKQTSRAKTVRRRIQLTPFGRDFCTVCLPTDVGEIEALTAEN